MSRTPRRDQELSDASEHLLYEVDMFHATALGLASGLFPTGRIHDALLESFIVHGRNLLQFLYPQDAQPSDVIADDFFPEPTVWYAARGDIPASVASLRHRANKEVAHLTYDRLAVTLDEKGWNYLAILKDIEGKIRVFRQKVPQMRLSTGWLETTESEAGE